MTIILRHRDCGGIFRESGRKAEYDVATLPIYVCDKCGREHDSSDYEDTHFDEIEEIETD